jgi:hypothetical protein
MKSKRKPKNINPKEETSHEVKKMKMKEWPFDPLGNPWIDPCGGDGPGPGNPH